MLEEDVGNKIIGSCRFPAPSLHILCCVASPTKTSQGVRFGKNVCSEDSLNGKVMADWLICACACCSIVQF
jgi:hypothetical protein